MSSQMRVLIAGGGIAGMATAMACQKAGINAEIYEAYDESAGLEAGAYLTVAVYWSGDSPALRLGDDARRSEAIELIG